MKSIEHGGWALPYFDSVMGSVAAEGIAKTPAMLFGRRTYEDFYAVWPKRTAAKKTLSDVENPRFDPTTP
ncbi:MAG: hypothetical protein ACREEM_18670 [Blastocatellia bacterium]